MPFLAWAAVRFGQREAAVTMLVFAVSAIWGTLSGYGPFRSESLNQSLVLLQAFLGVGSVMSLVLSAEICERRRAELEARSLATVDPLTGLGNQRKLIESLEAEIRRAERSRRSLVFVLLDLDGLKRINDRHGHLVGNRAICRLADALRLQCRGSDTTARYGGDEFAIILPDSNRQVAESVTRRIQAALLSDPEHPSLSVSVGVAVWPEDGATIEELLRTADGALYEMKKRGGGRFIRPAQQCS
jgi:diguanylate cyclase (GGDEF)-like protein